MMTLQMMMMMSSSSDEHDEHDECDDVVQIFQLICEFILSLSIKQTCILLEDLDVVLDKVIEHVP